MNTTERTLPLDINLVIGLVQDFRHVRDLPPSVLMPPGKANIKLSISFPPVTPADLKTPQSSKQTRINFRLKGGNGREYFYSIHPIPIASLVESSQEIISSPTRDRGLQYFD